MESTAVPGLAGKGVLDLAAEVDAARMLEVTARLVSAGWQRQAGAHAFPDTRPMLVAAIAEGGTTYRAHLHLVVAGGGELRELLAFRDALRADASLRARYVERKRSVLSAGIDHGPDYAEAKSDVVVAALVAAGLRDAPAR